MRIGKECIAIALSRVRPPRVRHLEVHPLAFSSRSSGNKCQPGRRRSYRSPEGRSDTLTAPEAWSTRRRERRATISRAIPNAYLKIRHATRDATRRETRIRAATTTTTTTRRHPMQQLFCRSMFSKRAVGRVQYSNFRRAVVIVNRAKGKERERERHREGFSSLRKNDTFRPTPHQVRENESLGMAQNVNPFSSMQNTPTKAAEEKQSLPKDNHAVSKRLQKELMVLMMSTEQGVSAFPEGENLFKWIGTITGPRDTVYAGLTYKLTLEFPHSYPYSAPIVRFATPCFHPNVDTGGNICLDILKDKWSALYDVRTILLSIQSLLGEPNNESPLNLEAAELWNNQTKYKKYLMEEYNRAVDRTQSNRNQQDS